MPNQNGVTLLQMDGILTQEEFEKAVNMALEGCRQIYTMQKEALKKKYVNISEEIKEEAEE
jgi:exosome complex component RRP41